MAKIVIAGSADCPYYAKIELLADSLQKNVPDFKLHKIVKHPDEWEDWLNEVCESRGFHHNKSPIVWRELVDRGGKGTLIGGANEFQEYVYGYYGLKSSFTSEDVVKISLENIKTKEEILAEEKALKESIKPVRVCITNAGSLVCYSMMEAIAKGEVLGENTDVAIMLLAEEDDRSFVEGLQMEVIDMACPRLRSISNASDPEEAFKDSQVIILLDEVERLCKEPTTDDVDSKDNKENDEKYSESKEEWLKRNNEFYVNYAKIINEKAQRGVKVIVAGNGPVNFNACMMLKHMPNVLRQNVVASSRAVENHAKSVIAERLRVNPIGVVDVTVWGHSYESHFVDISKSRVHHYDGAIWGPPSFSLSVLGMIHDDKWIQNEFPNLVKTRREKIEKALQHPAAASHAAAVASLLHHWWCGSPQGQIFSLGVYSEGWYNVPEGLVFSFPVTFNPAGYWTVVQDIDLTEQTKSQIELISKDLLSEKEVIYPSPNTEEQTSDENVDDGNTNTSNNTTADGALSDEAQALGRIKEDVEGEQKAVTDPTIPVPDADDKNQEQTEKNVEEEAEKKDEE